MMRLGRGTAAAFLGLAVVGCDLVLPLPEPHLAEEAGADQDAYVPDAGMWDAYEAALNGDATPDVGPDQGTESGDDGGGEPIPNPCPSKYAPCCGFDPDSGAPGKLLVGGAGRIADGVCAACLALDPPCDPESEFCCAPGGDYPPFCLDLAHGSHCLQGN